MRFLIALLLRYKVKSTGAEGKSSKDCNMCIFSDIFMTTVMKVGKMILLGKTFD